MTYKDLYMKCNTIEELIEFVNNDVMTVHFYTDDIEEVKEVRKAAKEVAKLKFKYDLKL